MRFLQNAWHLAAWAAELKEGVSVARTISGERLVLFREAQGAPAALIDRCPHRFAPLSLGRVEDGLLRCGYHGLAFGSDGVCVKNPHGPVSRALRVRALAVAERYSAIWVWMGDKLEADADLIPDFSFIDRVTPDARVAGYLRTKASYLLMIDNIMDLSHADYLHPDSLGGGINTRTKGRVDVEGNGVSIKWHAANERLPPVMSALLPRPEEPGDFRNEVYWSAPGNMCQRVWFGPAGRLQSEGLDSWTAHVMTPETDATTHYFFCHTSDSLTADPRLAPQIEGILLNAFRLQDAPMLEAQQANIGGSDLLALLPALLPIDAGSVAVRRKLSELLAAELQAR